MRIKNSLKFSIRNPKKCFYNYYNSVYKVPPYLILCNIIKMKTASIRLRFYPIRPLQNNMSFECYSLYNFLLKKIYYRFLLQLNCIHLYKLKEKKINSQFNQSAKSPPRYNTILYLYTMQLFGLLTLITTVYTIQDVQLCKRTLKTLNSFSSFKTAITKRHKCHFIAQLGALSYTVASLCPAHSHYILARTDAVLCACIKEIRGKQSAHKIYCV